MPSKPTYTQQAHEYYRERLREIMARDVPRSLVVKAGTLAALGGSTAISQIMAACFGAPSETSTGAATSSSYQYSKFVMIEKYHWSKLPWSSTPYGDGVLTLSGSGPNTWDFLRLSGSTLRYGEVMDSLVFKKFGPGVDTGKDVLVGHIADRWQTAPDYSYTDYHIRPGVHFHNVPPVNGRLCTADDVKFTFDVFRSRGITRKFLEFIDRVEVLPDRETVRFHLTKPVLFLGLALASNDHYIHAPEHMEGSAREYWLQQPIGTGPFTMSEQKVGDRMLLQRHPGFGRRDDRWPTYQLPFLREVRYVALAANVTVQAAMRSGQLDIRSASDFVEVQDLLSTNPELTVQIQGGSSDYGVPWTLQHRDPLLADVRIRRALNLAIDRKQMIDTLFGGNASAGHLISWNWLGYSDPLGVEDLSEWQQFNPTRAKQLLSEAGYPNGFELEFVVGGQPTNKEVMAEQMLAAIGVRLVRRSSISWLRFRMRL